MVTDIFCSEHAASQLCSVQWDLYSAGSVHVHSQLDGAKPQIKKWYKLARGIKAKRHKTNRPKTRAMCILFVIICSFQKWKITSETWLAALA